MHSTLPVPTPSLDDQTRELGRRVFEQLGRDRPSAFSKNYWSNWIMEWSMERPELKVNMFRLVDVLPALKTSKAIARHVNEYLGDVGNDLGGVLGWGMNVPPDSWRAKIASLLVTKGVHKMASQFIAGSSPRGALSTLKSIRKDGQCFTVDLLGEFSVSEKEARAYLDRYLDALDTFGAQVPQWRVSAPIIANHPGEISPVCVSVKLSALYSQCNSLNFDRSVHVLTERLTTIARRAATFNALVYVDAEDSANNWIIYETFKRTFGSEEFRSFPYPGIVVQAYAKDSEAVIKDLVDFAKQRGAPIAIRLVKGAYWDYETVTATASNWESPLFTFKESTDANFEKLTRILLDHTNHIMPAFGSHNIRSLSHACAYAKMRGLTNRHFELQMLYGMATPIAAAFQRMGYLVRLYVPLGEMLPGMGYLVRRLLENTSNESFLRHTFFESEEVEELLREPAFRE